MHYRSFNDLHNAITNNLHKLPKDIDLVVGIPRSGLLVANLIALYLNLPLTDLNGLVEGRIISAGERLGNEVDNLKIKDFKKVLVVDDSVRSGKSMKRAKETLCKIKIEYKLYYACVYVSPNAVDEVDIYFDICKLPRVFEWNIMHHPDLETACMDIDGVLCRDPTESENDDGEKYLSFLANVSPQNIPTKRIGTLVTCRLEKYRYYTETWLNKNGVDYSSLVMMNYPDKSSRIRAAKYSEFKADIYRKTNSTLFIESSLEQARKIANLTGKSVYCWQTREMLQASILTKPKNKFYNTINIMIYRLRKILLTIKLFKNWQEIILSYILHRPIKKIENWDGLQFNNDKNSQTDIVGLYTEIFIDRLYDPKDIEPIKHNDVIIDIGANIGIATCYFAVKYPSVQIISYEPARETYKVLTENVRLNNINNVLCCEQAVGSTSQNIKFYMANNPGHSTTHPFDGNKDLYAAAYDVKQITIDQVFTANNINKCALLKLYCEGAEYEILFNIKQDQFKLIERIYLEYHDKAANVHYSHTDIIKYLEANGYQLFHSVKMNPRNGCGLLYFRK